MGEERPVTEAFRREHPAVGWTAGFLWESKYVTEGKDNLEEGGIFAWEAAGEISGFAAGAWFTLGDSEDYQELNLFVEYAHEFADVETYVGYNRLEFYPDHESDNELSAGVAYHRIPYVVSGVDYVYSTEAEGSFVEVSLRSDLILSRTGRLCRPISWKVSISGTSRRTMTGRTIYKSGHG